MKYLSICSGIEAASQAWEPLGFTPIGFSEIEPFPRSVLAHHYPNVPLHGDFTQLRHDPSIVEADILVGGPPCQAFSIAGLRGSLGDERGNLTLEYVRLANAIDDLRRAAGKQDAIIVYENVPGILSVEDNAFGALLGGLVGSEQPIVPDGRWASAGVVVGPRRVAAWRVLDAQFFGLAQRRRRVFVLAHGHSRGWQCADALLPITNRLSGHPAPRREKGKVAPTIPSRSTGGGGLGTDFDCDGGLVQSAHRMVAFGEYADDGSASAIKARDFKDATDLVAHSLRGEGFDASEDGTGRGTPLVPVAIQAGALRENPDSGPDGVGVRQDGVAYTLEARAEVQAVCFTAKDYGADASDISPTLRSGNHSGSHANGGVMPAVAFTETADCLYAAYGTKWNGNGAATNGSLFALGGLNGRLDDSPLSREEDLPTWAVRELLGGESGSASQERRLAGQPTGELGAALSKLSHQRASPEDAVQRLWRTTEGAGLLQQALSALQAVGRSDAGQGQSKQPTSAVRRLTPRECERLQGFPDDYTLVPHRGKPAADGPRYKALGNSMAVPCMSWIGKRIAEVDAL